VSLEQLLAS
jgi:hypothetical protein